MREHLSGGKLQTHTQNLTQSFPNGANTAVFAVSQMTTFSCQREHQGKQFKRWVLQLLSYSSRSIVSIFLGYSFWNRCFVSELSAWYYLWNINDCQQKKQTACSFSLPKSLYCILCQHRWLFSVSFHWIIHSSSSSHVKPFPDSPHPSNLPTHLSREGLLASRHAWTREAIPSISANIIF